MSGIAAIYHGDRRPVSLRMLEQMSQAMAHRGPDGITHWVNGSIGLGHCLLHTTPESLQERYPICDGSCYMVWDGRLDNREELVLALKSERISCGKETDPELVLGAYRLWGPRCVEKILGEFAFVLWDECARTLFGARDRMGLKPFYYCQQGATLLIASEQKALLKVLERMPDPDDELLLACLLSETREPDNHRSLFAGIKRLPPGHVMVVEEGRLRIERYWQIDPTKLTVYKRPEAYAEHFLALLKEAVRCRLRSAFPMGCELSGGLDSSSVTILAASHGVPLEAFTSFSNDPATDERRYARAVCEAAGIPLWEFFSTNHNPLEGLEEVLWKVECPLVGTVSDDGFTQLVRSRNCRIRLTGEGGDFILFDSGYLADVLLRRGPVAFLYETGHLTHWRLRSARIWGGFALKGLAPASVKFYGKRLFGRIPPFWINQKLARQVTLASRIRRPRVELAFPSVCQTLLYQGFSPYYLLGLELVERFGAWFGQEIWHPFHDSRLLEFCLSIPWETRRHQGEKKWLLRQAMKGLLPEAVRTRRTSGDGTNQTDRDVGAVCSLDPPEPLANRSGMMERYLDSNGARKLVERYRNGKKDLRWEVWSLVALDHFLKRFWKGGKADVGETAQETLQLAEAARIR